MDSIITFISHYTTEIVFGIAILSLISFLIALANYFRTSKILRKYKRLMRGSNNKNLEAMLNQHMDRLENRFSSIRELELSIPSMNSRMSQCLQRVGIVRYNAFEQMGGNQSFSVALLDEKGNGIVLTGLYSRNSSAIFAKPIQSGLSTYDLSNEEKEAIDKAFQSSST